MPPIRRYLRISKYSILECRIYLDNPSDTRWLLDSRNPVLPRIFAAIRPLVLPKLREANERLLARKKGNPVKDVIAEDDFEVALFLRESRTRHSLLTRQKTFEDSDDAQKRKPVDRAAGSADTGILVESDDEAEAEPSLHNIPAATDDDTATKRPAETDSPDASPECLRSSKRQKRKRAASDEDQDEKKLRSRTNYESFNIYGWVLCLLVTRKGVAAKHAHTAEPKHQVLMEEWMATQAQGDMDEE